MSRFYLSYVAVIAISSSIFGNSADDTALMIDPKLHHIRNAEPREWSNFPAEAEAKELRVDFELESPEGFSLLTLQHKSTKQTWAVTLNDKALGKLIRDHNHLESGFLIPPGTLTPGTNTLLIKTESPKPDDILVGAVELHRGAAALVSVSEAASLAKKRGFRREIPKMKTEVSLTARDASRNLPIPCRFTIIDADSGALVFVGAESSDNLAVREGVAYSLDGRATFRLAGSEARPRRYKIYCGRGFEYGLETSTIEVSGQEEPLQLNFSLVHEVETPGLVACDPHLHTFEFDRHGDCTLTERLISVAGEGIELPVSTAHDKHIDYGDEVKRIGVSRWCTTVPGCEVTTHLGHFNTFPILSGAKPAEHKLRSWSRIFHNIFATPGVRICILNHGRDVHRGYTPLHPDNFDSETGTFLRGEKLQANAMELINSGAQQTDPMELVRDWFSLLKSGHSIAPIGSSDSHTVNFAIPGQARTYIRADDSDVTGINVDEVVDSLLAGKSMVSFGLLTTLEYHSKSEEVSLKVLGPSWTRVSTIELFRNGVEVRSIAVPEAAGKVPGTKYAARFSLKDWDAKSGDFICAVASGPGIAEGWWPMMPPYQPDKPEYRPFVMGISEAVYLK
ncbi:MAG: hypothetical protein P1U89_16895 [Verrucomicrobiales bacterium]|nr:hypothetical protein [Verrucomicrobiales bacterium]